MRRGLSKLQGRVVVVTGASSGIGRAAALQFAELGCRLALAARRLDDLQDVAFSCRRAGGEAICVGVDVTVEADVQRLADSALAAWGRVDVWVNNAGVTSFARLWDGPFSAHKRVIETNLFGAMLGARVALPIFREQGHGTLINVASIAGKIAQPFVPSYTISKFAMRGLSNALRGAVADEPDIHVCTLLPFAVDTPHFQTGASEIPRRARMLPPAQSPEKVARALVELAARPRREVHVPRTLVALLALYAIAPGLGDRLLARILETWHFGRRWQPRTTGNLYEPIEKGAVHGARPPRITTPRLLAWAAAELIHLEYRATTGWLHRRHDGRAS